MNQDEMGADETFGGLFSGGDRVSTAPDATSGSSGWTLVLPGLTEMMRMSPDELATLLKGMLSSKRREDPAATAAGDLHEDGSLRLPSMEAVWLLTKVGAQTGKPRFFDLRKIQVSRLRSVGGIALVIHEAFEAWSATA